MNVVEEHCPNATICLDPFHVVQWATNALDGVRRGVWNAARQAGLTDDAKALKGARWALWHNDAKRAAVHIDDYVRRACRS
jgi:transposase